MAAIHVLALTWRRRAEGGPAISRARLTWGPGETYTLDGNVYVGAEATVMSDGSIVEPVPEKTGANIAGDGDIRIEGGAQLSDTSVRLGPNGTNYFRNSRFDLRHSFLGEASGGAIDC